MAARGVVRLLARRTGPRALTAQPAASASLRMGGAVGNSNAVDPPYHRIPLATQPHNEESELIWHDGVAPETAIDFDAPFMSTGRAVSYWLGGLGFFFLLFQLAKATDPEGKRPGAARELPEESNTALGNYKKAGVERGRVVIFR